ncbi:glutaredoxin [Coemansia sp. S2]|nr:glutaredoxin [Coemansia sp. S3946]KAJ2046569.1 glutaredoxin [Coemansia sp. S2]KAJ2066050.1 glutaredoxin [Coemansia sp. S155-1]KAJ2352330.1 glutaredoxin [Coemansia sp. RSA 2673]KAJ2427598.1 glutaredoxin [Coemansia sp. RSA 2531]
MTRHPSFALRKIIPPPEAKPIWNRSTPTALERAVALINSSPLVLFARRKCIDSKRVQTELVKHKLDFRLVYLDDLPLGNIIQRRLQDLTGQWTVPNLFAKSESIGGYRDVIEALQLGKVNRILDSNEWTELVYAVRPDAWVRDVVLKKRSEMSLNMSLQDSHKFSYVHRERWSKIKRYLGKHPEIEEFSMVHRRRRRKSIPMQPLD